MKYVSTRGTAPAILSKKAVLKGIADDQGLYVPESFPHLGADVFSEGRLSPYAERAAKILQPFMTDYGEGEISGACRRAYGANFDSPAIAPVTFLDDGTAVLELWHGPTLAFKDMALQLMPHLLSSALKAEPDPNEVVILVATSGDTGKAALEGFAGVSGVRLFVFFPHQGVSDVQRLQMVTQRGGNVGACAVKGNFDDTQSGVKRIFADPLIQERMAGQRFRLSSANSINWGRLAPQVAYYFTAYAAMAGAGKIPRGQAIPVCVPTGNFGNILAAYYAVRCGLPVSKLICASNRNNVLTDFIRTGVYDRRREFFKTESPSMDILISSNLERLLFEISGRKAEVVSAWMGQLSSAGWYAISRRAGEEIRSLFYGGYADQKETAQAIQEAYSGKGYLMDPHTAVGYSVLKKYRRETGDLSPALLVSTASPFKFNRAVLQALGRSCGQKDEFDLLEDLAVVSGQPVPAKLAELRSLPELHTQICEKQSMAEVLWQFLSKD